MVNKLNISSSCENKHISKKDENRNLASKTIIIKVFDKRIEAIDFAGGIDKSKKRKYLCHILQ